ncbi:MAG: ABC transporter permease, partial [Caldilineae bacterium]
LDEEKNADRTTSVLLRSSPESWLKHDSMIQPDFETYPDLGFPMGAEQDSYPLAVSVQGVFESYFKDRPNPWEAPAETSGQPVNPVATPTPTPLPSEKPLGVIDRSPETARLVVFGSAEFVDDILLQLSSTLNQDRYLNNLALAQNAVDWSVEDLDLLAIRARGDNVRVLKPLSPEEESRWEMINYAVALLALVVVAVFWRWRRRHERPLEELVSSPQAGLRAETGD